MPYEPPFPFSTGYVSSMSENDLLDLIHELEATDFWRREKDVQEIAEKLHQQWARRVSGPLGAFLPTVQATAGFDPDPAVTVNFRSLSVKAPMWLTSEQARLLIEVQLREQMDPAYDPTEA